MSTSHGRRTVVLVNDINLSTFCDTSNVERAADVHDTTTYGTDDHTSEGGLLKGSVTMGGLYDTSLTAGPQILKTLVGQTVSFERRLEGTGSGLPVETMDVVVEKYNETAPVADFIKWTMDGTRTGPITDAVQT